MKTRIIILMLLCVSFSFAQNTRMMNPGLVAPGKNAGRSNDIEQPFWGNIYSGNSWSSTTGFIVRGATVSISGNKFHFTSGASTFTQTLEIGTASTLNPLNGTSMLDKWHMAARVIIGSKAAADSGFAIGKRAVNGYAPTDLCAQMKMASGGTGGSLLLRAGGSSGVVMAIAPSNLSFSIGDTVLIQIDRDGYVATSSVRNITTNSATISTLPFTFTTNNVSTAFDNTGRFAIFSVAGTFDVDSISVTTKAVKNAKVLIEGDSKMAGYSVTSEFMRFGGLLNGNFRNTVIEAGGSDRSIERSYTVTEVLNLRPQQIIQVIGSNDVRSGAESSATYYARYDSISNAYIRAGIDVYHMPLYEPLLNLKPLYDHIVATFPASRIFPSYNVLQEVGSIVGDNVHPSDHGDTLLFKMVVQSCMLFGGNQNHYSAGGAINNIPKYISGNSIGQSQITDNGSFVGINKSTPLYKLDINGGATPTQVHISFDGTDNGLYLTAATAGNSNMAGGAAFDGANWIAKFSSQSMMSLQSSTGRISWYENTGLTPGNSFTPSEQMRLDMGDLSVTGKVRFGNTIGTPLFPLDLYSNSTASQVHWGPNATNVGGYLTSNVAGTATIGTAYFNATNWIATANEASLISFSVGSIIFYNNTGTSSGNSYTPTEIARFKGPNLLAGTTTDSSAFIHVGAGSTTKAGIKVTAQTLMTTPVSGIFGEFDGTNFYAHAAATRYTLAKTLTNTASLDFASTGSGAVADLTITLTGAAVGDAVVLGVPNASVTATATFTAWVSSTNTVTVRFSPKATEDPASGTFRVSVLKY